MSPSEFWLLTPNEAGLILDDAEEQQEQLNKPQEKRLLTKAQVEHLDSRRAKLRKKGFNVL